jgi:hypothetical protein
MLTICLLMSPRRRSSRKISPSDIFRHVEVVKGLRSCYCLQGKNRSKFGTEEALLLVKI